jgi:hypothetical protein
MKDIHTLSVTISHYITLSLHYHCHGRNPIHTRFGSRRHFVLTLLRGRGRIHHTLLVAEGRSLRFWKGQMGQILLEMLWGLEYSIFFIILMISMCFLHLSITMISRFWLLPRSWSWDPGHCLRIFCYYPSWRVPLYIVDGCTYFNVYMLHIYICIYIYTYILYLLDWSLQFIPLGFGLISKLMDIISLDPRNAQLPRCRAARWRNVTFLRISSCSSWCKPLRNDETRSII